MKKKLLTNRFAEWILLILIRLVSSDTRFFKFVPVHEDYPKGSIRRVKRKGVNYELDISDYQEWLIYFHCKTDSSDYVLNYLGKAEIIFDIGANIGQTAFNMFQTQIHKGLNPVIYAFEPFPQTFGKFETNLLMNKHLTRIHALNLGLSNQQGTLYMSHQNSTNSGAFRMTNDTENSTAVKVTSLDTFISEQQIPRVDFIKIDVEGYELQVLEGAMKAIRQFKPVLVFEYSVKNMEAQGGNIAEALNSLLELGYSISTKEGLSDLNQLLRLTIQTDLICIPK